MVQVLYSIAAIMLLGVTVLNINIKAHGAQDRMMFSELALEMTSVGAELLNEIGKYSYDPAALRSVYGYTLQDRDALRPEGNFGAGSPCAPDDDFSSCLVINDFHGKTATRPITRTRNGVAYTVEYDITDIRVRYVDETPPHASSDGEKTFAKEATVTISTPALVGGDGNPVEITMSRVYLYPNYERGKPYSTF